MASIRKRSPWRVVVDKDTANAAVFDTFKQAAAAARILVAQGTVLGFVQDQGHPITLYAYAAIGAELTAALRATGNAGSGCRELGGAAAVRPTRPGALWGAPPVPLPRR
jgi:hypothetical protein